MGNPLPTYTFEITRVDIRHHSSRKWRHVCCRSSLAARTCGPVWPCAWSACLARLFVTPLNLPQDTVDAVEGVGVRGVVQPVVDDTVDTVGEVVDDITDLLP